MFHQPHGRGAGCWGWQGPVGCGISGMWHQWDSGTSGMWHQWDALPLSPQLMCFIRFFYHVLSFFPPLGGVRAGRVSRSWGMQQLRCAGVPLAGDFGGNDNTSLGWFPRGSQPSVGKSSGWGCVCSTTESCKHEPATFNISFLLPHNLIISSALL